MTRPRGMLAPALDEQPQNFSGLRWDSICSATNVSDVLIPEMEESLVLQSKDPYPDTGESGETYNEEMMSDVELTDSEIEQIPVCPTCGQPRRA